MFSDPEIDGALKLRPFGGLIGISNSSLDSFLDYINVLRHHAYGLYDAAGFKDCTDKSPENYFAFYFFLLNNCWSDQLTGLPITLFVKIFLR